MSEFNKSAFADGVFSWQAALNLALTSSQAYRNASEIEAVATSWGFTQFAFFDNKATQAFAAADSDSVLIGFRGSEAKFEDWFGNFNALPKSTNRYGTVHLGFYSGYHAIANELLAFLDKVGATDKALWIGGHSLGGALALIATAELHERYTIAATHTVGQPRTGRSDFAHYCDTHFGERYVRIVNNDDLVTRIPPHFSHAGKLQWFNQAGEPAAPSKRRSGDQEVQVSPEPEAMSEAEFAAIQQQVRDAAKDRGELTGKLVRSIPGVTDHDIDGYIRLIGDQVRLSSSLL